MPALQKTFEYQGDKNQGLLENVNLKIIIPQFSYYTANISNSNNKSLKREIDKHVTISFSQNIKEGKYKIKFPVEKFIGNSPISKYGFIRYHGIEPLFNKKFNDFVFTIKVKTEDSQGNELNSLEHDALYGVKINPLIGLRDYFEETDYYTKAYGLSNSIKEEKVDELLEQEEDKVFLINKKVFDEIWKEIVQKTTSFTNNEKLYLLLAIETLVDLSNGFPEIKKSLNSSQRKYLTNLLVQYGVDIKYLSGLLANNSEKLFDFPVSVPAIETIELNGTFKILSEQKVESKVLEFYDLSIEYPETNLNYKIVRYNWGGSAIEGTSNSTSISFTKDQPILLNTIDGNIWVRVKGFDGSILWSKEYGPNDAGLQQIAIEVPLYIPDNIAADSVRKGNSIAKRLRGKVIQLGDKFDLNELTIVIQAKKEGDQLHRIVGATKTDKTGNFSLDYPYGQYAQAQALVSLMPNSPAGLEVKEGSDNDETISNDFIFLLLQEADVAEKDGGQKKEEEDCDCNKPARAKRLPDQADLIESGEYTQDIGGTCLNLTTPNRTLREYNYNAIVRISDPDVANYTLNKKEFTQADGTKTTVYELEGGGKKLERGTVDLNNPVRWEDAPEAKSSLSIYQAVTVATGHILHFKSVFKADGYSLGDLVYSLPLAPGQKKQIVVFESSHNFKGAESQSLEQGEGLSASLLYDRYITDEIGGRIGESLSGRSSASTAGLSVGLGVGGSSGGIGASLGIAGGYSRSRSSASQNSSRSISQFFDEVLRQRITQNAESYRALNASVVTTASEDQKYGVTAEAVANHNHCHSLTLMYFEVLRHYAIYQELSHVEECLFVPLLMTNFTTENIHKWKDVLAINLLPIPSNTYLGRYSYSSRRKRHPLLKAFDANERIKTEYNRVDFPEGTYADEPIKELSGFFKIKVHIPRPKTRFDRILSFPVIKTTITSDAGVDVAGTIRSNVQNVVVAAVLPCMAKGPRVKRNTTTTEVLTRGKIFDMFMDLDANFETVPPAQCIRVKFDGTNGINIFRNFIGIVFDGDDTPTPMDFFAGMKKEKRLWEAYAQILDMSLEELFQYFNGNVIADWDRIFNEHIAPQIVSKLINEERISILPLSNMDLTEEVKYRGGNRILKYHLKDNGIPASTKRKSIENIEINFSSPLSGEHHDLFFDFITLSFQSIQLNYTSDHHSSTLINRRLNNDLKDGSVNFVTPLNSVEKKNPRKEDNYLVQTLIQHLNSNLEHYNKILWRNLDSDRRFMLLDGFNIEVFNSNGRSAGFRSLASVVKNQMVSIAGNSLVLPVADGYKVSQSFVVEEQENGETQEISLLDHYKPLTPIPPYRVSVPTRGVFMEAVQGSCDACEMVKENSSQDWDKFRTEEPTSIQPIITPTPAITEYKPEYKDFASPIVNIQNAPDAPAPAAGLSQLSELLGNAGSFNDITGLAKNQQNAIDTYLSNQANAKAFAEMASSLATQQHNTNNSPDFMNRAREARESGAISEEDYGSLVRQHLQQQIDGGETNRRNAQNERERNQPSLAEAAIDAISQGHSVQAERIDEEGIRESINVQGEGNLNSVNIEYQISPIRQPDSMACWATAATMLMNWKNGRTSSIEGVLRDAGNNLIPPNEAYYLNMLNSNSGLAAREKNTFVSALGMVGEPPANFSLDQYINWLQDYGPLWMTTDASIGSNFSPHAKILYGIRGDQFYFIDPATGRRDDQTFREFIIGFEQMATDNSSQNALFIQVVRFRERRDQEATEGSNITLDQIVPNAQVMRRWENWLSSGPRGVYNDQPIRVSFKNNREQFAEEVRSALSRIMVSSTEAERDFARGMINFSGDIDYIHNDYLDTLQEGQEFELVARVLRWDTQGNERGWIIAITFYDPNNITFGTGSSVAGDTSEIIESELMVLAIRFAQLMDETIVSMRFDSHNITLTNVISIYCNNLIRLANGESTGIPGSVSVSIAPQYIDRAIRDWNNLTEGNNDPALRGHGAQLTQRCRELARRVLSRYGNTRDGVTIRGYLESLNGYHSLGSGEFFIRYYPDSGFDEEDLIRVGHPLL